MMTQEIVVNLANVAQPSRGRRGWRWWMGWILRSLAVLVLLLLAALLVAGTRARANLQAAYPPAGRLVDVGGYRLHIHCQGEGGPVVVVDSGQGDFSLSWAPVQAQVAQHARICVYDRAGLGWSDPSPHPRTVAVMVEELHTLLANAGIPGPYVLVGSSLGGINIRLYAHQYPDDVAGIVFLDSAHEEQFAPVPESFERMLGMMPRIFTVQEFLVATGIPALRPAAAPVYTPAGLPADLAEQYRALYVSDPKNVAAAAAEFILLPESHAQMRAAAIDSLGEIPLVVLTHGHCDGCGMLSVEELARYEEHWTRLQAELAALSPNGRMAVAEGSGHAIHTEQPALVAAAIREVLTATGM